MLGRELRTGYWARKLFERLSDRQIDESPVSMTGGMSGTGDVDESLYDELFENSTANNQLDKIDNLYDVLMESSETDPGQFSEPVLIGMEGKEFEATLAEPSGGKALIKSRILEVLD